MSTRIDSDVTCPWFADAHAGSDPILMTALGLGVPSNVTLPVIYAAVDSSTFFASGAAAGEEGSADLLASLHAAAVAASTAASATAW